MKRQNTPKYWIDIAVTIDGVDVTGSYSLDKDDWMTVKMNGAAQSPLAAVLPPKALLA